MPPLQRGEERVRRVMDGATDGRWRGGGGVSMCVQELFQFVKVVGCGLCGVCQVVWAKPSPPPLPGANPSPPPLPGQRKAVFPPCCDVCTVPKRPVYGPTSFISSWIHLDSMPTSWMTTYHTSTLFPVHTKLKESYRGETMMIDQIRQPS